MDCNLNRKYNVVFIDEERYFVIDLSKRDYTVDFTTPFFMETTGYSSFQEKWPYLLVDIADYLIKKHQDINIDKILHFIPIWLGFNAFNKEADKGYVYVCKNIYVYSNLSDTKCLMLIQDLLLLFKEDPLKWKLLIYRPPCLLPEELKKEMKSDRVTSFRYYLGTLMHYDDKKVDTIVKNIDVINRYTPNISKIYSDIYLFNSAYSFYINRKKLINYLFKNVIFDTKNRELVKTYLNFLEGFYKDFIS